ncbi:MAG: hypothetical protein K8M05_35270 [Deltaproteobacteria bacterium]|nr:hypothetical protein [Kofleriaceae bacterium]
MRSAPRGSRTDHGRGGRRERTLFAVPSSPCSTWPWLLALTIGACGSPSSSEDADAGGSLDARPGSDGPDEPPSCDCPLGQSCPAGDGVCVDAPLVAASLRQRMGDARPALTICLVAPGGLHDVFAEDGDCTLSTSNVELDPTLDVGLATVSGPTIGSTSHDPRAGCPVPLVDLDFTMPLPAGEPISFALAGGADVAAMTIDAQAPSPVDVSAPAAVTIGAPAAFTWTPGAGTFDGVIALFGTGGWIARCTKLGDSGSLVLTGALSQMMTTGTAQLVVGTFTRTRIHTDDGVAVDFLVTQEQARTITIRSP